MKWVMKSTNLYPMQSGLTPNQKYYYVRRGKRWAVYHCSGTKITDFATMEEARREVFRLNGWKYKEPKKK